MLRSFSTWVTLAMLAIFSTMVVVALGFPVNARFMPLVIGLPGIGLCLLQLVLDWRGARRATARVAVASAGADEEFGLHTVPAEARSWLYFLGFVGGVLLFGFAVASPVLIALYLRREAGVRLGRALLAAAVCVVALRLVFGEVLNFQLFGGFLTADILRAVGL